MLGLSHTFITSVGVVSAVVGMAGSWVWGRLADRTAWNCLIWLTAFLNLSCTLGWSFVRPSFAHLVAPVLIVVAAGCALLFFVAGIGGFANLIINGRKLPSVT